MENKIFHFKYPIFFSLIYLLLFLIVLGLTIGLFFLDNNTAINANQKIISLIIPAISMLLVFLFLWALAIWGITRLQYSFSKIRIDIEFKKIYFGNHKMMRFSEIEHIEDMPNRGLLLIKGNNKTITIPKEISNYTLLYEILLVNELLEQKISLNGFVTKVSSYSYGISLGLLAFSLVPFIFIPSLTAQFDGSLNNLFNLLFISTLGIGGLFTTLSQLKTYEFTDEILISKNLFFTKRIYYSNIESIDYDITLRRVTINLRQEQFKKLKKNMGMNGLTILEPSNMAIEQLLLGLNAKVKVI